MQSFSCLLQNRSVSLGAFLKRMGKRNRNVNKFAQRKRERREQEKKPQEKPAADTRKHYEDIVRENATFEEYYKTQKVCPEEEWPAFMAALRQNLPTAFRITGSKSEAAGLMDLVRSKYFSELVNMKLKIEGTEEEEEIKPINLPWYPGGLAWQLRLSRTDIRRSETLYRLHNFLVSETAAGGVSRQETVSMIPPVVLDVKPHHKVLDMCAAPGSKTAQLIEFLHADEDKMPTGFVMANDVDNSRCYMLVHQAKRLNSPCILITNHDSAVMPSLLTTDDQVFALYDVDNSRCYMLVHQAKRLNSPCILITNHDSAVMPSLLTTDDQIPGNHIPLTNFSCPAAAFSSLCDRFSKLAPDEQSKISKVIKTCFDMAENGTLTAGARVACYDDNGKEIPLPSLPDLRRMATQQTTAAKTKPLKFDRILCDVPCSGDATLRKNPDIWLKWSTGNGNNLHGIQYRVLRRGCELLAVGGRLVYSTCSFNPIENEAVIHRVLQETGGSMRLVDAADMLPGLKFNKGMTYWRPASKDMVFYEKYEDVPEKWQTVVRPQMFPPQPEDLGKYQLDKCIRILPHHQDTGGFFVAVLEKTALLPWEKPDDITEAEATTQNKGEEKKEPPKKKRRMGGYREDPFVFFKGGEEDVYPSIKDYYQLSSEFDPSCLLTRCHVGKKKNIYLVSPLVKDVVTKNEDRIKIINTGVKTFVRCDNKNMTCAFRLSQEGLQSVLPYIGAGRRVRILKEDLITVLQNDNPSNPPDIKMFSEHTQNLVKDLATGSCVLEFKDTESNLELTLVGWRGVHSLRAYTASSDTVHYLRLLGADCTKYDVNKFKKAPEEAGDSADVTEALEPLDDEPSEETNGTSIPESSTSTT